MSYTSIINVLVITLWLFVVAASLFAARYKRANALRAIRIVILSESIAAVSVRINSAIRAIQNQGD